MIYAILILGIIATFSLSVALFAYWVDKNKKQWMKEITTPSHYNNKRI